MGDYEAIPAGWGWRAAAKPDELSEAAKADGGRLICIHRPDGVSDELYTGVWVVDAAGEEVDSAWRPDETASDLDSIVANAKGRLVAIDAFIVNGQEVRFAAVWVTGKAAESVVWGWQPDMSKSQLRRKAQTARLICLRTYEVGGERRYAAVWVSDNRTWDWSPDIGFEDLRERLHDFPGRLVSLDPFLVGTDLRFAAIWVDAADQFAKLWWWEVGTDEKTVSMNCELFCSHLVETRRIPGAADAFVHFRHGFPRPPFSENAQLVEVTGTATLTNVSDSIAPLDQTHELTLELSNVSGETVEIETADLLVAESGWSHPAAPWPLFESDGLFDTKSTAMPAGDSYAVSNVTLGAGIGASHYVVHVRAKAPDGHTQLAHVAIPILRQGFAAPEDIEVPEPVYLGLWHQPIEVVPIWKEGEVLNWITIGAAVLNNSGQTLRIGGLHLTLEAGGDIVDDRELPLNFRHYTDAEFKDLEPVDSPVTVAHAELPSRTTLYVTGYALPGTFDPAVDCDVTLVLNYKIGEWCGAAVAKTRTEFVQPMSVRAPVKGQWNWGNSPAHVDFDAHAWPGQRFSSDLTILGPDGSILRDDPNGGKADPTINESYYAYGEPVYAIAKGVVVTCEFGQTAENKGNVPADPPPPPPGNNWVLLSHEAPGQAPTRSGYYHLRPIQPDPAKDMQPGDVVLTGQLIGYVGNIGGSSDPHLHWGWAHVDATGRGRLRPIRARRLRTPGGENVTATPADGEYTS
jgi:Peptidase family M23/Polyglycine hydrolase-like, structural repeat